MLFGVLKKKWLKLQKSLYSTISRFFVLLTRPFIDFYYNYGLSRASVMSYVLCANLIIFMYLILAIALSVDAFGDRTSIRRLLELHLLWPSPEKMLIEEAPTDFELRTRDLVTPERYNQAIERYCQKKNLKREILEKEQLRSTRFSITRKLGESIYEAIQTFQKKRFPLTISFFTILVLAYVVLLLNIKTSLAESVSPLIWGNLPLANRSSELMKILWRIPHLNTIKKWLILFFMLPSLVAIAVLLLLACHKLVDGWVPPYTFLNNTFTVIVSFVITGFLFTGLYKLHVTEISKEYAAIGAFTASALWLGGRWMFTTYGAVSLYLNLRNFAFVPIILTWFYYFCTVFLFGIYVAHTLETPKLASIARWWEIKDLSYHSRYTTLAHWVKLDFLYRLAQNRNEEYRPPYIGINLRRDTAQEIACKAKLSPPFVRECILDMIARNLDIFCVEVEGNQQYCTLRLPPDEVNVIPLITGYPDVPNLLKEMDGYEFGSFILGNYGPFWKIKPLMLSEVYRLHKQFEKCHHPKSSIWKKTTETDEIFL